MPSRDADGPIRSASQANDDHEISLAWIQLRTAKVRCVASGPAFYRVEGFVLPRIDVTMKRNPRKDTKFTVFPGCRTYNKFGHSVLWYG